MEKNIHIVFVDLFIEDGDIPRDYWIIWGTVGTIKDKCDTMQDILG